MSVCCFLMFEAALIIIIFEYFLYNFNGVQCYSMYGRYVSP